MTDKEEGKSEWYREMVPNVRLFLCEPERELILSLILPSVPFP